MTHLHEYKLRIRLCQWWKNQLICLNYYGDTRLYSVSWLLEHSELLEMHFLKNKTNSIYDEYLRNADQKKKVMRSVPCSLYSFFAYILRRQYLTRSRKNLVFISQIVPNELRRLSDDKDVLKFEILSKKVEKTKMSKKSTLFWNLAIRIKIPNSSVIRSIGLKMWNFQNKRVENSNWWTSL